MKTSQKVGIGMAIVAMPLVSPLLLVGGLLLASGILVKDSKKGKK